MTQEIIQEISELYPFVGVYTQNRFNQQFVIREKNPMVNIPRDLRLTLENRRKAEYTLLDMILAESGEKIHSDDLRLEIQQRTVVSDLELDKFLLYVTNGEEFGVPYVLITDVPLQLGIIPSQTNAKTMDQRGRINIGDSAERAGLEREIVFFGAIDHIRIYSADNWERYKGIVR